jgi:DNA-binding CsgD family transcriptional regulator/PAS domain-containing protein
VQESEILGSIYEAALEPERWNSVLVQLCDFMGANSANLTFQDQVTGQGRVIVHGTDQALFDRYFGYFATRNPLLRIRDFPAAPCVMTDEDKLPKDEFVRGEYYNDFLRHMDAHSILILRLAVAGTNTTVMNLVRPARRDPFDGADIERTRRLHPHLIRALRLTSKFSSMEETHASFETFVERSAAAVFLVDAAGHLRHCNRAGEELVAAKDGLAVRDGVLCAADASATRRLRTLIATACDPDSERRSGGSLSLGGPGRVLPLSLTVIPARSERVLPFHTDPCALVCAVDPEKHDATQDRALSDVLGLSRAECRIAAQLLAGHDPRRAAHNLGLSYNTVRAHLARIMGKTGTHRQAELVGLLMRATAHSRL